MLLPAQVTIIPLFKFFASIGWVNTYLPLIVPHWLGLNVFGIIPRIPFADEDANMPAKRLVTTLAPKTPVVEAFRAAAPSASSSVQEEWLFQNGRGHCNERGNLQKLLNELQATLK